MAKAQYKNIMLVTSLCIMLTGIFFSGKWGVAAVSHDVAMNHFNSWTQQKNTPDLAAWETVHDALVFASDLDAKNTEYLNDLGRFYEYTAGSGIVSQASEQKMLLSAAGYFRKATVLRPAWAIAWANLALIKHRLKSIDKEFESAMFKAVMFGGALPPVQLIVAEAGVANWAVMSIKLRQQVVVNLHHSLNSPNKRDVLAIINAYQMMPYFCLVLPQSDKLKLCDASYHVESN